MTHTRLMYMYMCKIKYLPYSEKRMHENVMLLLILILNLFLLNLDCVSKLFPFLAFQLAYGMQRKKKEHLASRKRTEEYGIY